MKPGLAWVWGLAVWGGLGAWPSAAQEPEPAVPRVAVVVLVDPFLGNPATVVYDRRVAQSVVARDLTALAEALGVPVSRLGKWQLTAVAEVARLQTAAATVQTQVSFHLPTVVDRAHGAFRLAPFVQAFQAHRWLSLDFLVSDPFPFQGLRDYEDDRVRIRFQGGRNTYNYWIYVKEVNAAPFSLPVMAPSPPPVRPPASRPAPAGAGPWIGVLGLACLSGLAVFLTALSLAQGTEAHGTGFRIQDSGPKSEIRNPKSEKGIEDGFSRHSPARSEAQSFGYFLQGGQPAGRPDQWRGGPPGWRGGTPQ